ncbi:hypothetical protein [uncultured Corynebacterium sp.]|uniref:hypothetical protein n=1 Tax=uncultured Corynebacterium sp. TaxID=159447 RepID=UPI002592F979|nr:hypothetical protein [uncultured Corynebacterium sp.]
MAITSTFVGTLGGADVREGNLNGGTSITLEPGTWVISVKFTHTNSALTSHVISIDSVPAFNGKTFGDGLFGWATAKITTTSGTVSVKVTVNNLVLSDYYAVKVG